MAKNYVRAKLEFIAWHKERRGCAICGERHPYYVLDMDHAFGEKEQNLSKLARKNAPWEEILIEIQRCIVACSNCHRKLTHSRTSGVPDPSLEQMGNWSEQPREDLSSLREDLARWYEEKYGTRRDASTPNGEEDRWEDSSGDRPEVQEELGGVDGEAMLCVLPDADRGRDS